MKTLRRPYVNQVAASALLAFATFLMTGCNVDSDFAHHSGERTSVTKQDDGTKGEALIQRGNFSAKLTHVGQLQLSAKKDDVESLAKGGRFQLSESEGNAKCVYTIEADEAGNLKRSFSRNGKDTAIDEDVQVWFGEALERTVRESGF